MSKSPIVLSLVALVVVGCAAETEDSSAKEAFTAARISSSVETRARVVCEPGPAGVGTCCRSSTFGCLWGGDDKFIRCADGAC